jgi:site-specific DNA recombinase
MGKSVAVYIRVSSEEQKNEGLSLNAQENKLVKYCNDCELEIFRIYKDEGKSAKSIKGRKGFIQLLEDARKRKFSAVIITKFDRAFRNVKDSLNVLEEFAKLGIDFISLNEKIDTTTAFGKAMFTIISLFAQLERELTGERNKEIMENKFNHGIPIARFPFGYKPVYKNPKEKKGVIGIEICPKQAEIVQDVFKMALNGVSYREICKKYDMQPQTYYNMIRNKFYIGITNFGGVEKEGSQKPLITKEDFEKVNKK